MATLRRVKLSKNNVPKMRRVTGVFISAEDGGEEEARADDHPGNVDNVECVLDRERCHPGVSAAMPAARACRRWDPCYRRRRSGPGGFREDWNMHLMS